MRSAPTSARLSISPCQSPIRFETLQGKFDYQPGMKIEPAFFEETDYEFTVELLDSDLKPSLIKLESPGRQLPDKLRQFSKSRVLSCVLNVELTSGLSGYWI